MVAQPLNAVTFRTLSVEEAKVVTEFIQVLRQEQEALVAGQADLIAPLAEQKTGFCQRLDRFARQRLMLISASGIMPGASLNAWLSQQGADVRSAWDTLLGLAQEAQNLNRQNGQIIANLMQTNSQTLNVLLAAANRASLYGPDGHPRAGGGSRILGKV